MSYSHLGDALGETAGWYGDYARFVSSSEPWFRRGGNQSYTVTAGVFYFNGVPGGVYSYYGFRVVLTATE